MFTFLHAADIHLDSPLKGLEIYRDAPVEQIRWAARRAFDNLVDLAIEEEVAFVLLAGDLYDGDWKDYNTGIYFVNRMGRLRKAGIPVFMVSGNHDAASQITRACRCVGGGKVISVCSGAGRKAQPVAGDPVADGTVCRERAWRLGHSPAWHSSSQMVPVSRHGGLPSSWISNSSSSPLP